MQSKNKLNNKRVGTQGWKQFQINKEELLYKYGLAKKYSRGHLVEVTHGNIAEANFREWLSEFLPKKYGVSSGYIISQNPAFANEEQSKFPHYDVIIYDRLNSPILWIEDNSDNSKQGHCRAFPVEYVYGVIEVKSTLNTSTSKKSVVKLNEIIKFTKIYNPSIKRDFWGILPTYFFTAIVYYELKKEDLYKSLILNNIIHGYNKYFYGGIILSNNDLTIDKSGLITVYQSSKNFISNIGKKKLSLSNSGCNSDSIRIDDYHLGLKIEWSEVSFARFAFDILANLNRTYRRGYMSSLYGISWINEDND